MPETMPTVNPVAVLFMLLLMVAVVGSWVWVVLRFAFGGGVLPRFTPRVVPWGGKSVLVVFLAWVLLQVGVQYAFLVATQGWPIRPKAERAPFQPAQMMTASALQNAAVLVAIPLLLGLTCGARPRDYGVTGGRAGREFLLGMVTWPLVAPIVYGMMLAAVAIWGRESHPLETAIQQEGVGGKAVIFFLAGAVLAPAAEELIFRGVLLGWMTRLILQRRPARPDPSILADTAGPDLPVVDPAAPEIVAETFRPEPSLNGDDPYAPPQAAITAPNWDDTAATAEAMTPTVPGTMVRLAIANVAVSLLFGSLHYSVWPTPVPIFFLSLALGLLYQRTGSLIAPTALHMTFNGVSTILMFLTIGMNPHRDPARPAPDPIPAPIPRPVDPITKPPIVLEPAG